MRIFQKRPATLTGIHPLQLQRVMEWLLLDVDMQAPARRGMSQERDEARPARAQSKALVQVPVV